MLRTLADGTRFVSARRSLALPSLRIAFPSVLSVTSVVAFPFSIASPRPRAPALNSLFAGRAHENCAPATILIRARHRTALTAGCDAYA